MTTPAASPSTTWPELLTRLLAGRDLTQDEAAWAMAEIMGGEATPVQVAGFLVALRAKGETVEELHGLADVMLDHALRIEVAGETIDIVGTGGDRHNSVNISTMSGIVLAGAGLTLVKHGNRAASSASGSADVLEALGVSLSLTPSAVAEVAAEAGITFCFAQAFHPAMRHAAVARRELGVGTAFNMLGPLTNPAAAPNILMGVFHPDLVGIQVRALQRLGTEHAVVVYGRDGMDEVSLGAATLVGELRNGEITEYEIHPEDFGLPMASARALRVETPEQSQAMLLGVLENQSGAARDIVLLNAGVALYAANVADSIADGIALARATLASGSARQRLRDFVAFTKSAA